MADVIVTPSVFTGDATCPRCGQLLWFIQTEETTRLFDGQQSSTIRDRIVDIVANRLGVDGDKISNHHTVLRDFGVDSLDAVELVMELEEEFGLAGE